MKIIKNRGYTLIELIVVVALLAILAAVTVPKMTDVNKRTELSETTNMFQRTIAEAKSLAMKNRRAVVVEVRGDSMWVNILTGSACDGTIDAAKRCFQLGESQNDGTVPITSMCGMRVATVQEDSCEVVDQFDDDKGMGLCYNGSGQLWIRRGIDTNANCSPAAGDPPVWEKACVPWISSSGVSATQEEWFSGADVRFNDDLATCQAGVAAPAGTESITRRVLVPAGGHPIVKLVGEGD